MSKEKNQFFVAGGALRYDAPSYVEREADRQLQEFTTAGELCYVLTTRQMGKSSLMVRTEAYLQSHNIQTVIIDLTDIGTAPIDAWFLSVLDDFQSQLALVVDVEEWWEENSSLSQVKRFTKFIREVIPQEVEGQVAIFIDEIDAMLNLDFADDFFAAIRALYNRRASLQTEQCVSFVLLGVAAPNDLIKNQTKTPFNVGQRIRLEELSLEEAQVLIKGLPDENQAILERIFYWTNGHPYLTQKIGQAIARDGEREWNDSTIDDLVERLFLTDEESIKERNLQFVRGRVVSSANKKELISLYRKVYVGNKIHGNEQSIFQNELKLYGLLRTDDEGLLTIRNRIYHRVFDLEWINENSPVNWWRRLAVVATLLITITIIAGVYFWQRTPEPDDVLAQSYMAAFENTTNPTLRLDNLANIFVLGGYDQSALELFGSLPANEQLALFENLTPDLAPQVRETIQGIYVTLYVQDLQQAEETTPLLQAMSAALEQSGDAESRALHDEIRLWLEGRSYAAQEDYLSARTTYGLALSFNGENPATRLERSLTAVQLDDPQSAISDLAFIWQQGAQWEGVVLNVVGGDDQIRTAMWLMDEPPPFISFFPSPTPTSTPTNRPTATPTFVPSETPTNSPTPSATNTAVPPSPSPVPTNTPVQTVPPSPVATNTEIPQVLPTISPTSDNSQSGSSGQNNSSSQPTSPPEPTSLPEPTNPPEPTSPPVLTRPPTPPPP